MMRFLMALVLATATCATAQNAKAKKPAKKKANPKKVSKMERAGAKPYVYKTIGDRKLKLYVLSPEGHAATDKLPAVVFYHGGGWTGGGPGQFCEHGKYLTKRGMVTVHVQYRLLDRKSKEPPITCINDAKSAMRWVRAHADELGIDPERVAAGGGSAGGHLAACVGLLPGMNDPNDDLNISARAHALVLFNPVYNNGPGKQGWSHARCGDDYKKYSPAHAITKDAPPTLVFLGTKDKLIPVATAEAFRDEMTKLDCRSELVLFEGEGHGFFNYGKGGGKAFRKTVRAMDEFFISLGYLSGTPTMPEEP